MSYRWIAIALVIHTTLALANAYAKDADGCGGKTELQYVGAVLFVTEPVHHLKLNLEAEAGILRLESDEGDGLSLAFFEREKKLEIVQDPMFGSVKKKIDCQKESSIATCGEYLAQALSRVKQAQFHLTSEGSAEDRHRAALGCAETALDRALAELSPEN